jgi:DNA-binding transcriptional MerR regulator
MFSIGEFSRLGKVTVDALRHYDALDLLKPAKVDPFTGYRYYSARQLTALNHILALKELGFSLEEIARILQEHPTTDELRGMLKAQLVRADTEIGAAQVRRDRILARLNHLNLEDKMPAYEVTLKPVEQQTIASIRETVGTIEQMPERCSEMFGALAQWMSQNGVPFGPSLTIYHNESYRRENIDTECAFLLPDPATAKKAKPDSRIRVRQVEAVPLAASTIVADNFYKKVDGLTPAYTALAQWIEDNGYKIAGLPRELFYGSAHGGDLTAEVVYPVEKA